MRKLLFIIVAVLALTACTKSLEERAEELITDGIRQSADDPSSVQDVTLDFVSKKQEVDLHGNKTWHYYVSVDYREKNEYGGLVKRSRTVVLNEECTEVEKWNYPYY